MHHVAATAAGSAQPNEDWHYTDEHLVVVLDGATGRTDLGCTHGVAWYAKQLGMAIVSGAQKPATPLKSVLADAISHVASLHAECDLNHPGTPSAGVAVLREVDSRIEHLVLGDVAVVLDTPGRGVQVAMDLAVRGTAADARREANRWPIGSPQKQAALQEMKRGELAARNRPDGYWIAAADPAAAEHALTGDVPSAQVRQAAVLSDGVERLVSLFKIMTWRQLLDVLEVSGPDELIRRVREIEGTDPLAERFARNKASDDATAVRVTF